MLTNYDIHLFSEGSHFRLYEKLGCQLDDSGAHFGVWAPNAARVSVIGDFNNWDNSAHDLKPHGSSGIWCGHIEGVEHGSHYKFHIESRVDGYVVDKTDPFANWCQTPPETASVAWRLNDYEWGDSAWLTRRKANPAHTSPISIYELHLGSWRRAANNEHLSYRDIAAPLAEYVTRLGFTHIELMPIMEHPFYGSWGYQVTGYFAPTARYGTPQDLMYLVDVLHQRGIGVILDWVPAHFPTDEHGLGLFDGTHLFEHADPRKGFHPDWTTLIYNYGRNEVQCFLISSAISWLDRYHIDGLRVDGVASMLYLDYSRKEGEWLPNEDGSNENREAVAFLRRLNETVYAEYPDAMMMAEESTAWPKVSRPTSDGGLGFGFKWDMGWMHDSLEYLGRDPIHRKHHHDQLTFRAVYMHSENYVLPLSHDEVVHGKGSLLDRFPGDQWRKLAQLRLLLGCMYAQPGKKLLFMGAELGQTGDWNHEGSVAWELLEDAAHAGVAQWVADLNNMYRKQPALYECDTEAGGFSWLDSEDRDNSVLAFLRIGQCDDRRIACVFNFTPIGRTEHRIGLPFEGTWQELLNSDATIYGGTGEGNQGAVTATKEPHHGQPCSATINLPPFGCVFLRGETA